jgi:hypothetical protein
MTEKEIKGIKRKKTIGHKMGEGGWGKLNDVLNANLCG